MKVANTLSYIEDGPFIMMLLPIAPFPLPCLGHFPGLNIQAIFTPYTQCLLQCLFINAWSFITSSSTCFSYRIVSDLLMHRHCILTHDDLHESLIAISQCFLGTLLSMTDTAMHPLLIQLRPAACRGHEDMISVLFCSMCFL